MTSNKDVLEMFEGLMAFEKQANDQEKWAALERGLLKWVFDNQETICTALASQNPAGTGNKDALEAFEWLLEYHLKPQPYRVKYNDKFCVKRNIVRAALSQPTPWRIDDSGNPVPFHTYNPKTHILVAREDVPAHLLRDLKVMQQPMAINCVEMNTCVKAAALIAQKTEE